MTLVLRIFLRLLHLGKTIHYIPNPRDPYSPIYYPNLEQFARKNMKEN